MAEKVREFCIQTGMLVSQFGVIQSNPAKSKHLETATLKIMDESIDFVNLRSEKYGNTRIPEITFGTAVEDAFRRDLTINALFYNIQMMEVEDFTGKGLSDLKAGIIRTPLAPKQTFLDDPLRILRAIRFASRFNYKLDPAIFAAVSEECVQTALKEKVSKERLWNEIDKMIRGRNPFQAFRYIHDMDLY